MGGFRFNGCGVTDHFKCIKSLGMYQCPHCKKITEYTLDEANQKVDVFWIPTLTLKSRYAVMCKKCQNGEFCSTEWAGYLLNQTARQEIIFESEARAKGWTTETRSFQEMGVQQAIPEQPVLSDIQPVQSVARSVPEAAARDASQASDVNDNDLPKFFKCPYCGVTQMREGDFCAYCGKSAPEPELLQETSGQEIPSETGAIICPGCGNRQEGGKFCFQCGRKLTEEKPVEKSCPYCGAKVKDGMLFCMECGTRVT